MDYLSGKPAMYTRPLPLPGLQKKEELHWLNNPVPAYPSILRTTRNPDEEVITLKNIYESELEKLRKDIEAGVHERHVLEAQCSNQQKHIWELQTKLSQETKKSHSLSNEIGILQTRIGDLDSQLQGTNVAMRQPQESLDQIQRCVNDLSSELEQWKHRCEQEQLSAQEAEKRLQQMILKMDFNDQVHDQQIKYYQARLEVSSSTIQNLETHIQEQKVTTVPNKELPNQVSTELSHNEPGAEHARYIKSVEGDNTTKQSQAIGNDQQLVGKLRDVYNIFRAKVGELGTVSELGINLQSEIEAFKTLLDMEEKRLEVSSNNNITTALPTAASKTDQPSETQILETPKNKVLDNSKEEVSSSHPLTLTNSQKAGAISEKTTTSQLLTSYPKITDYGSSYLYSSGVTSSHYPYELSPPINTFYIPQELRSVEGDALASHTGFNARPTSNELHMPGVLLPMTGPQYNYNALNDKNQLYTDQSPPLTSHVVGPIKARSMSATAKPDLTRTEDNNGLSLEETKNKENEKNSMTPNFASSQNHNVPDVISFQNDTKINTRSTFRPLEKQTSSIHDSTCSAIGDLKILEVNEDGKFVRLHNDGPTEFELGGYMIQQIVADHPEAVFRFPPHTKFPSDSTITVWSAMNDPSVHNPPTDVLWRQQEKWKKGTKCTTVLCRPNGERVAWMTDGHRVSIDSFHNASTSNQDCDYNVGDDNENEASVKGLETLTELKVDLNGPRPEPTFLKRAKKEPPSLEAPKHPHGFNPATNVHPVTGQPRPLRYGNDNSTYSRQSRTQTTRPDPVFKQPCLSAPVQRIGSNTISKRGSWQKAHSANIRENGDVAKLSATTIGETCEGPSPFMKPHYRFERGLEQVRSQHHQDFLPPLPSPPIASL